MLRAILRTASSPVRRLGSGSLQTRAPFTSFANKHDVFVSRLTSQTLRQCSRLQTQNTRILKALSLKYPDTATTNSSRANSSSATSHTFLSQNITGFYMPNLVIFPIIIDWQQHISASTNLRTDENSKLEGSYHWLFERVLSITLLPLVLIPMFIGPTPIVDFALALVLPIHCHLGFSSIITDYLPKRKFKYVHATSIAILYIVTLLSMYGCYEYNTNSIGITALVARLWTEA